MVNNGLDSQNTHYYSSDCIQRNCEREKQKETDSNRRWKQIIFELEYMNGMDMNEWAKVFECIIKYQNTSYMRSRTFQLC